MAKTINTPGPWEAKFDEGEGTWRVRQKGTARRVAGASIERTVAEGFRFRPDAVQAAAAPELADALQALLQDYQQLSDSGDAGNLNLENSEVGLQAYAALRKAGRSA